MPIHGKMQDIIYRTTYREARNEGKSMAECERLASAARDRATPRDPPPPDMPRYDSPCGGISQMDVRKIARQLAARALAVAYKHRDKIEYEEVPEMLYRLANKYKREFSLNEQKKMDEIVAIAADLVRHEVRQTYREPDPYGQWEQSWGRETHRQEPDIVQTKTTFLERLFGKK